MKTKDKLMLMFSVLFLLFVILIFVNAVKVEDATLAQTDITPIEPRTSITFILGEDLSTENTYFANAEAYFTLNPLERTDRVNSGARSLNEMYAIINSASQAYSDIHIVLHSNPWAGMSLPIDKGGDRIEAETLISAMFSGKVEDLKHHIVDTLTNVHIHACGLGNNRALVSALSETMNDARIITSEGYVNFSSENGRFSKSDMEVFYAFYPTAYKPADLHLARQLSKRYPEIDRKWMAAMHDFSYKYNIPVEWEIKYGEHEVPALENEDDKNEWLMNQDELLDLIEKTGIPFDYFRWIVKKKDDRVVVFGKVTVLCVLEEMRV